MTCFACKAEVTNGLGLCATCQQTLRMSLVNVASFHTDVLRIQPGQRVKVRGAYQSTPPPGTAPARDRVSETADHVSTIVFGWVRNLEDDRPGIDAAPVSTDLQCGWLEHHVPTIATLDWAGEILRELMDCERMLQRLLDKADTGWYAGVCGNEIGREWVDEDGEVLPVTCEHNLYGTQGSAWVRCPTCGRTWDAGQRRDVMIREARDEVAPIAVVARAVVGLLDGEASVAKLDSRIRKAVKAGRIQSLGVRVLADKKPHRVYRIGDVFDMLGYRETPDQTAC